MDGDEDRRIRRARVLLIVAVAVIGGFIALVLWQDPPASFSAGLVAALAALLLSGIAEPFGLMLAGNGASPFQRRRHGRDADLEPVAPRTDPVPEPGLWGKEAVFGELARLVEAEHAELRVLGTRSRVRVERRGAASPVACDLVVIGYQLLEHREVGDPSALRDDVHEAIDRVVAMSSWQIADEIVQG